jgi:hypothetical protein
MNFLDVWDRIKKETPLRSFNDLADLVETSQPNVSRQKKEGTFPAGWAYEVAKKYGLLTEWIMTGEGPKRLTDPNVHQESREGRGIIEEWVQDIREREGNDGRIIMELAVQVPEFREWYKEKKSKAVGLEAGSPHENVA